MSKLRDLLAKNDGGGAANPSPAGNGLKLGGPKPEAAPPATKPAAGGGIQIGKSSTPSKQTEQPNAAPASGLNALIAGKKQPATASKPRTDNANGTPDLNALANIDITLTNDVATWPNDLDGIDMSEPANQMRAMLNELSHVLLTEDVSHAMQRIMVFLHENPNLKDTLLPEDIGLMVKSLQASHGVVIAKKTANKKKTSVKKEKVEGLAADLADLGFELS